MNDKVSPISLFSDEELSALNKLEAGRRLTRFRSVFIFALIVLIFSVPALGEIYFNRYPVSIVIASVFLGSLFTFLCWYFFLRHCIPVEQISMKYKKLILPNLLNKLDAEWNVGFTHRLLVKDIIESGVYKGELNSMIRDDYFFGPTGENVAEVFQAYFRVNATKNVYGRYSSSTISIGTNHFCGLFFRIHFQHHFPGRIWIFPLIRKTSGETDDWAEITGRFYGDKTDVSRIFSGNAGFDTAFYLVSDKPSVSQSILTPERIMNLQQIANSFPYNCAFSFVNNHAFAMVGFDYDLFDVENGTSINEEHVNNCYEDLKRIKMTAELLGS